jgi:hypothetical protein
MIEVSQAGNSSLDVNKKTGATLATSIPRRAALPKSRLIARLALLHARELHGRLPFFARQISITRNRI